MKPRKSKSVRKLSRKSVSRKPRKSVSKKSSRKSRKSVSRKSRKSVVSKKSSRKSRKSVSKKSSRKSRKKSSRIRKVSPPPKKFMIPFEILEKLDQSGFRLGEFLGEGMSAVAYEVYKKNEEENKKDQDNNNRYVLKIIKERGTSFGLEIIQLRELGELVKEVDHRAFIIKYCGESLLSKWRRDPNFMPLKDALVSLLENVRDIHKKGWAHNDIKPDNICVQQKKDGTYRLKLMDFGQAMRIFDEDRHPFGDAILSTYKHNGIISVNDFKQKNAPVESLNIKSFTGNIYWPIRPIFYPSSVSKFKPYDDVEAAALSLWSLYDEHGLPWTKYYTKMPPPKDVRYEIIKQRLDENLCPFEIIREVLREAWNGSKMDLDGLIKRLKERKVKSPVDNKDITNPININMSKKDMKDKFLSYTIVDLLGSGDYGIIYHVIDKNGESFALKVYHSNEKSENEINVLRDLGELKSVFKFTDGYAILMTYHKGGLFSDRAPDVENINDIAKKILEQVQRLHQLGWMHCDIKPDNVMITDNREVKLIDFGNAQKIVSYEGLFGEVVKPMKRKKYNIKSVEDFQKNGLTLDDLDLVKYDRIYGNKLWSLSSTLLNKFTPGDDIEAVGLMLWDYYLYISQIGIPDMYRKNLPWDGYYRDIKYFNEMKNRKSFMKHIIISFRLQNLNCPFPVVIDIIQEARKGSKMNLKDFIKHISVRV